MKILRSYQITCQQLWHSFINGFINKDSSGWSQLMHLICLAEVSTDSSLEPLDSWCWLEALASLEVAIGVSMPLSDGSVSEESAHSAMSVNSNKVAAATKIASSRSVSESELLHFFFPLPFILSSISVSISDSGSYSIWYTSSTSNTLSLLSLL